MKYNEKLQHLNEEEIRELLDMYQDKSVKIPDILAKFKIDSHVSGLYKLLPPRKVEIACRHCEEPLYQKEKSRTNCPSSVESIYFCLDCGHYEHSNGKKVGCECKGCKAKQQEKIDELESVIREMYGKEQERIKFEDLPVDEQIMLIYILKENGNSKVIYPHSYDELWIEYINRLRKIKAISPSPESDLYAFFPDCFPFKYSVYKVTYNVNVDFTRETLQKIEAKTYFLECVQEEALLNFYKRCLERSLFSRFKEMLEDRNLTLMIYESGHQRFRELLDLISYTQILYLCSRVAKHFSDKVLIGETSRFNASKFALTNVSTFYHRSLANEWNIAELEIGSIGTELDFFIYEILGKEYRILKQVPSIEGIRESKNSAEDFSKTIGYALDYDEV